jgi:hypothetical protein
MLSERVSSRSSPVAASGGANLAAARANPFGEALPALGDLQGLAREPPR